jgi:hypothetical protein
MAEPERAHRAGDQLANLPVVHDDPECRAAFLLLRNLAYERTRERDFLRSDIEGWRARAAKWDETLERNRNAAVEDIRILNELRSRVAELRDMVDRRDSELADIGRIIASVPEADPDDVNVMSLSNRVRAAFNAVTGRANAARVDLSRLVIMAGGSWDQDRVEECVEAAAARLRELRVKEDAQGDADERLAKALAEVDRLAHDPDRCGATEGATGVTCSLIRWHSLSVEHEGSASPEQEKSVGTPLFVRWPWNEYDQDWAVLRESSSDLLIQEGTRG